MALAESDLAARALSVIIVAEPLRVADLTVARALRAGVTAEIAAGSEYADSQALARDVQDELDGVRWRLRHDVSAARIGVVLFGPEGAADVFLRAELPQPTTGAISPGVIRSACSTFGYEILPDPPR